MICWVIFLPMLCWVITLPMICWVITLPMICWVLSYDFLIFHSESLHCFELCFVRLHRRRKAPYAALVHLVYIYIYIYLYVGSPLLCSGLNVANLMCVQHRESIDKQHVPGWDWNSCQNSGSSESAFHERFHDLWFSGMREIACLSCLRGPFNQALLSRSVSGPAAVAETADRMGAGGQCFLKYCLRACGAGGNVL